MDGSPGMGALAGFVLAGAAIWLIAAAPLGEPVDVPNTSRRLTMALAVLAGVGFGIYFVALKMAGPAGVVWPMATARMGSLSVCSLMLLGLSVRGGAPRITLGRRIAGWAMATALLDTSGNLLFLSATRAGRLDVAAVLASLYPASTILLAALALGERPTRRQALGMVTAVAAVMLIAF
jgi:drug/metabolite transporter (DMT)-like permease